MPYASIQITREPRATPEQRATLIAQVTEAIVTTLDKDPETTFVVIEEIDTDSWGVAGVPTSVRRASQAPRPPRHAEAQDVRRVVHAFYDAMARDDAAALRELLHPEARALSVASPPSGAGGARAGGDPTAGGSSARVLGLSVDGPLAFARTRFTTDGAEAVEHLVLAKDAERWRITHRQSARLATP